MDCEIENDANCAALSALFFGKAKNIQDMAFLVIGTGVGGAIVRNRKICHGAHRYGGEFGMMLVKQADGSVQNFSLCASTSSMVRKMQALTAEEWNGVRIFEEAQQGNAMCREVIQTFYEELAFGVFNVQHMLDPEMILFGGAISARRDFTQRIMEAYEKLQKELDFETLTPRLECCTYRQDANLLGALAQDVYKRQVPMCIAAGLLLAIANVFAFQKDDLGRIVNWGFDNKTAMGYFMQKLFMVGQTGFKLMIPLFAGFVAKSIADKPAIEIGRAHV